jgi:hypothetical protein
MKGEKEAKEGGSIEAVLSGGAEWRRAA